MVLVLLRVNRWGMGDKANSGQRIYSKKNLMMAAGQLSSSFYLTGLVTPFLTLVVVTYAGLDAAAYGKIQAANAVLSFVMVFVTGYLFQKVHLPWGKARSWQYVGAIIGCVATGIMFSQIPLGDGWGKVAFYAVLVFVSQQFTSIASAGMYVLFPMMTPDPQDRMNAGAVMSQVGQIVAFVWRSSMVPLIAVLGMIAGNVEAGYSIYAWIVMAIVIACFFVMARAGKPYDPSDKDLAAGVVPLGNYQDASEEQAVGIVDMVKALFHRAPLSFLLSKLFKDTALFTINATIAYNFTFVYPSTVIMGLYFGLNALAGIVGTFISPLLAKRRSMRSAYMLMISLMFIMCVLGFFFGRSPWMSLLFLVLANFCYYGCSPLEKPLWANAGDYTVLQMQKPVRPFLMTALTLAGKVGGSIAPSVLGFILAYVSFDKGNITALAASGIHVAITLLPALYLALSLIFIIVYPVTRERLEGLRAKRAAEGAKYTE